MKGFMADRGAAAVEFALVVSVLLAMIFGVLEFGRMWAIQASLAQAARDAARTVAIEDDPTIALAQVQSTFNPIAADASTGLTVPDAVQTGTEGQPDCRWTVDATYAVNTLTGFLGDTWTVTAKGSMRCNG